MKNFVRILSLVLVLAMAVFCFAGCGSNNDAPKADADVAADNGAANAAAKTYIIYSDNAFAPFEYFDEAAGAYVGVDMDLLAAIAEDQGFTYEMHNEGFDASMGAVQSGQADAMIAGMTIRPDRAEVYDFSEGYFEDGQIMVVKAESAIASLEDLRGLSVAVKTSTAGADYAASIADEYGFTLQYYEDSPTMYTAVINGTNDACFEDRSVVGWAIQSEGLALKTIGEVLNPGFYGFAVKKGSNPELISMFNAGLANLKANGKYTEILAKYGY